MLERRALKKTRVLHYINQFFAGIGGEEKADIPLEAHQGPIGLGKQLQKGRQCQAQGGLPGFPYLMADNGLQFPGNKILPEILVILRVLEQVRAGRAVVDNAYGRAVSTEGNLKARELMGRVFRVGRARWRGLGSLEESGFLLEEAYAGFDAGVRHAVEIVEAPEPAGCACGSVLTGRVLPPDCRLFRTACTPEHPVGPCMVSSEGTCAAYYRYHTEPGL